MQKAIITVAGAVGSGKSSTAKAVAAALGYKHFSSGDLFRQIARERGLSIEAINLTAEQQKEVDYQVDELLQKMGREEEQIVIDSRLAWHWMPDSFKVYLTLDPDTAAERIYNHIKKEGRVSQNADSVAEVRKNIDIRVASEKKRYMNLYGLELTDPTHYDLVIDTKYHDLPAVTAMVLEAYRAWSA
jgi:cytidylate kinase